MSNRPGAPLSKALVALLLVIVVAETIALFFEYQSNLFMQEYLAQNTWAIMAEVLGVLVLGLGLAYAAYRVHRRAVGTSSAGRREGASFFSYLTDYRQSFWVYLIIMISVGEIIVASYGSDSSTLGSLRTILGVLMLGFIPGYCSQRAIFSAGEIRVLEQVLLSVFLSVIVSISLGTIIGYVHAFRPNINAIVLALYTVSVSLLAGYRASQTVHSLD